MADLIELCGSEARALMILNAVRRIVAEERRPTPAQVDSVCRDLPDWSECGQDECDAALALLIEQTDRDMQNRFAAEAGPPVSVEGQPVAEAEPTTASRDDALANLNAADAALAAARSALVVATRERDALRAKLATILMSWQRNLPVVTKEQALREVIATTQMVRAQRAGYRNPQNDGTAFLRKQMKRGRRRVAGGDVWTPTGLAQRNKLPSEL